MCHQLAWSLRFVIDNLHLCWVYDLNRKNESDLKGSILNCILNPMEPAEELEDMLMLAVLFFALAALTLCMLLKYYPTRRLVLNHFIFLWYYATRRVRANSDVTSLILWDLISLTLRDVTSLILGDVTVTSSILRDVTGLILGDVTGLILGDVTRQIRWDKPDILRRVLERSERTAKWFLKGTEAALVVAMCKNKPDCVQVMACDAADMYVGCPDI